MAIMTPAPAETMTDPAFTKLSDQAIQALAGMQKMCHQTSPDSPLADVLNDVQKVVAEIESQYQSGGATPPAGPLAEEMGEAGAAGPPSAAMEQGPTPTPMMGEASAPPPSGNPMFDAAAGLQSDMLAQDQRKKRQ